MPRKTFRIACAATAALALFAALPGRARAQEGRDAVRELVARVKNDGDRADPALVREIADLRTRAALEALFELESSFATIYMRREVVRALARFDGVPDAGQAALDRLVAVAAGAKERELREAALAALGECERQGKDFLRILVTSPAAESVRVGALERHVHLSQAADQAWYRELFATRHAAPKSERELEAEKQKERREKRASREASARPPAPAGPPLERLREIAFEALRDALSPDEIVLATRDPAAEIRAGALVELEERGDPRALEIATKTFEKLDELAANRVVAAEVAVRLAGPKPAPEILKRALSVDAGLELRQGFARVLTGLAAPEVDRELAALLGKSRAHEKTFGLLAARSMPASDAKLEKALLKLLSDPDPAIVVETCRTLAVRGDRAALPALAKLVEKGGKDKAVLRAALEASAQIRRGESDAVLELVALARHEDFEVRSMALQKLAEASDPAHVDALAGALGDPSWSVRLAALRGLERLRDPRAIGPIVERLAKEEGRLAVEFADTLFRLTGQGFEENAAGWASWWKSQAEGFRILTPEERVKAEKAREELRLRQTTHVKTAEERRAEGETEFFGVEIVSHRVVFVIDISVSMLETVAREHDGETGKTRDAIARAEISRCIESLDERCFFDIVLFCGAIERFRSAGLAAANPESRAEAERFVQAATLCGATNLYGALEAAFEDRDVDTIVVMSDGEPTYGPLVEPLAIREAVKRWNEHRGVRLDTIAIGGRFQILEWLAEDAGGAHLRLD